MPAPTPPISDAPPASSPTPPQTFDLTLEEYVQRLSGTDPRVELVNAFYADEHRTGQIKDSTENFEARYAAFQVRPA
jgi:hypothetical protein